MILELKAEYDSRKSFYRKANVLVEGNKLTLISYTTKVAVIQNGKATVHGTYSVTTLRHIREFLRQNGFKIGNKHEIMKDYGVC